MTRCWVPETTPGLLEMLVVKENGMGRVPMGWPASVPTGKPGGGQSWLVGYGSPRLPLPGVQASPSLGPPRHCGAALHEIPAGQSVSLVHTDPPQNPPAPQSALLVHAIPLDAPVDAHTLQAFLQIGQGWMPSTLGRSGVVPFSRSPK